ncbi:peptidoglycan editing factor PgeF [Methylocapsa sp. S129]|uniref:peptidoglycan editing factor PgeF n=1 Tax=Methylocapsa sp. S129 TaxID=1641869 RepID=UPI00131D2349|nr:peptidoglycan editing factor PgeF [Methylocapsa sp. S129]
MSDAGLECLRADGLGASGIAHAFFTRRGGVSQGVYASLNGGVGSRDDPDAVRDNRARMAATLGIEASRLLIPYQVHSPDALAVVAPWPSDARPRCDALVTATPGLGLGVTGADCGIILFAAPSAGVIGAAHAGWRGALSGIIEATVAAMEGLGARAGDIVAALGPTIAQPSYEVGPEFVATFAAAESDAGRFFAPSRNPGRSMFDLHGFIGMRVARSGVTQFEDLGLDTYADEERFFSYRRATHRKEPDYGRLVAAIALV